MAFHSWLMDDVGAPFAHDLASRLIVPRPIAYVSTIGDEGPNLAPFSYFMPVGAHPPCLAFCVLKGRDGVKKATQLNFESNGECVVNLVTKQMADGVNLTGVDYPNTSAKWGITGFSGAPSLVVKPDRVLESSAQFECTHEQTVEVGESSIMVGRIVAAHCSTDLFDPESGNWARFEPIARLGGAEYLDLACGKVFEMTRPNPRGPTS